MLIFMKENTHFITNGVAKRHKGSSFLTDGSLCDKTVRYCASTTS